MNDQDWAEAMGLLRQARANFRRPFGGWAPYDLPARIDTFIERVNPDPDEAEVARICEEFLRHAAPEEKT